MSTNFKVNSLIANNVIGNVSGNINTLHTGLMNDGDVAVWSNVNGRFESKNIIEVDDVFNENETVD